ncbi:MAG: hypothetical protein R3E79_44520 [Caldilineaceae bacterium]
MLLEEIIETRLSELKKRRIDLRILLENEAEKMNMDIDNLVRQYKYSLPNEPVWALVEDIHRQVAIYNNILEEVKRLNVDETKKSESGDAKQIREKYEGLGLVPSGFLPNPSAANLANYVLDKINTYAKGLLQLMQNYGSELMVELHFQQGTTVALQVEVGWNPKLTVGVECTVT